MSRKTLPCGVYRHYKGNLYQVLGVARHSETDELLVVYVALTGAHLPGPRMSVRPLGMFLELVETNHFVTDADGVAIGMSTRSRPRFEYVGIEIPEEMRR